VAIEAAFKALPGAVVGSVVSTWVFHVDELPHPSLVYSVCAGVPRLPREIRRLISRSPDGTAIVAEAIGLAVAHSQAPRRRLEFRAAQAIRTPALSRPISGR
jgi:hypothetical protein